MGTRDPVDGRFMARVASEVGTPLFLYDPQVLHRCYREMSEPLRDRRMRSLIAYSYKTNFLPAICAELHRLGAGAEIVAPPELDLVRRLGVPADATIVNGVLKTESMLEHAVDPGCRIVNLESSNEVELLSRLARERGRQIDVGVRVNPSVYPFDGPVSDDWMSAAQKFGHDLDDGSAFEFCSRVARTSGLRLRGLHFHLGSQITCAAPYAEALRKIDALVRTLLDSAVEIDMIDIGGGFGGRGVRRTHRDLYDAATTEERVALRRRLADGPDGFPWNELASLLAGWIGTRPITLILEPGRALVGESMRFLTRVCAVKRSRDREWAIVDGGVSHLPTLGPNEQHRVEILDRDGVRATSERGSDVQQAFAGPACHRGDVFAMDLPVARAPRVGDLLVIHDVGAYSLSMSNSFNAYRAPVVELRGRDARVVWRRETGDDVFHFDTSGAARTSTNPVLGRF